MNRLSEATIRRRLRARNLILVKVRESSRDWWEYGPYTVTTDRNEVVLAGASLKQVSRQLT